MTNDELMEAVVKLIIALEKDLENSIDSRIMFAALYLAARIVLSEDEELKTKFVTALREFSQENLNKDNITIQ